MKFRIVGADRETGEDVEIVVDARDQADAETIANRRNMMVSSVSLFGSPPLDRQPSPPVTPKSIVKQCPKCKEWIDKGATKCAHCRASQPSPPWAVALATALVFVPAIWCCGPCLWVSNSNDAPLTAGFEAREREAEREKAALAGQSREEWEREIRRMKEVGVITWISVESNEVRVDLTTWMQVDVRNKQGFVLRVKQYFVAMGGTEYVTVMSNVNDVPLATYDAWNGVDIKR